MMKSNWEINSAMIKIIRAFGEEIEKNEAEIERLENIINEQEQK